MRQLLCCSFLVSPLTDFWGEVGGEAREVRRRYALCQQLDPEWAHDGGPCDCMTRATPD
jgi:hypothetical protein